MLNAIHIAIRATLATLVLAGIAYPVVTTALSQTLFANRANGRLVKDERRQTVCSAPIGQSFEQPALGEAWVNLLLLNLALDRRFGRPELHAEQ